MKLLLRAAISNRKHLVLMLITMFSMVALTFASQFEILSFRIVAEKGANFFELFSEDGAVGAQDGVPLEEIHHRWEDLQNPQTGRITLESANHFLMNKKKNDWVSKAILWLDTHLQLQGNVQNLAYLLVIMALIKAVSLFAQRYSVSLVATRISCDLRKEYFKHLQTLPMSFYQEYNIGSLSARVVGDAHMVATAINAALINYIETPFKVITTLALCFASSPRLSFIVFLGFPTLIYPIIFLARRVKRAAKKIQKNQERFTSVIIDFLSGVETVKTFSMEEFSLKKYQEQNEMMAKLEEKVARYDSSTRPILHTIATLLMTTVLLYGLYVENMPVTQILFFCGLLYILYEPIKKFAEGNMHIQRGVAGAERMFEVLDLKPDIQDRDGAIELTQFSDSIEFDHVWFRYSKKEEWVLKDLSFKVRKGEVVALVGPTGSGKSTLVNLLPRLYDVSKGEIRFDQKPIQDYTQTSLRNQIAFVPQRPFLFLDTIEENICFGRNFTKKQVEEAARKAHAEEFIESFSEGYQMPLADAGSNLSGGQQQRIAIARALIKKSPILLMDEATSALDALSESKIRQTIRELKGEVTQVIIAHRLSILEDVDRIIYLEKGKKVAEGNIEELLDSCPQFKKMWELHHICKGDDEDV